MRLANIAWKLKTVWGISNPFLIGCWGIPFLSQNRPNAAPLLWLFSSETSWGPLNFFPFLSFTARSKKKSKRFTCNHSCLKLFGSSALLWDRNFTSHYIVWLADCEMMKCAPCKFKPGALFNFYKSNICNLSKEFACSQ